MAFNNGGETNQAEQSILSLQGTMAEILARLLQYLQEKQEAEAKQRADATKSAPESTPESPLEPDPAAFSPDAVLEGARQQIQAGTAAQLVRDHGTDGVYRADDYSIQADGEIYSIRDAQEAEIMKFENLGDRYVILEDTTTTQQQLTFAKARNQLESPNRDEIFNDPTFKTQVQTLGGLAPLGSKAIVATEYVLNQAGVDTLISASAEGQADRYTFSRDKNGRIGVRDNYEGCEIIGHSNDGKLVAAMSLENREHFNQLYQAVEKEIDPASRFIKPLKKTPQAVHTEAETAESPVDIAVEESQQKSGEPELQNPRGKEQPASTLNELGEPELGEAAQDIQNELRRRSQEQQGELKEVVKRTGHDHPEIPPETLEKQYKAGQQAITAQEQANLGSVTPNQNQPPASTPLEAVLDSTGVAPDLAHPTLKSRDSDGDGLTDREEYFLGSDPNSVDSDGDGVLDGQEVRNGTDPNSFDDPKRDIAIEPNPSSEGHALTAKELVEAMAASKYLSEQGYQPGIRPEDIKALGREMFPSGGVSEIFSSNPNYSPGLVSDEVHRQMRSDILAFRALHTENTATSQAMPSFEPQLVGVGRGGIE